MAFPGVIVVKSYQSSLDQRLPSPAVFADCPTEALNSGGLGVYRNTTFADGQISLVSSIDTNGTIALDTSSTVSPPDHLVKMTSGSTATAAGHATLRTQPLGAIAPGGYGLWFEASFTPALSTGTQSAFIGLATSTNMALPISTNTAVASTNLLAAGGAIGFWMHGDTPNNLDVVIQGATGGPSTLVANVLTAANVTNPNPAFLGYSPPGPVGAFVSNSTGCVKLGILYQPNANLIQWYTNGFLVAQFQPTAATVDTINRYAGVVEVVGTNVVGYVDFVVASAQFGK